MKFAVVGGDGRSAHLADYLAGLKKDVSVVGMGNCKGFKNKINHCDNIGLTVQNSNICILPMPVSKDSVLINAPYSSESIALSEIFANVSENQVVFGGLINPKLCEIAGLRGIKVIDYYEDARLLEKNAQITAEGAIMIAMQNTEIYLPDAEISVIGAGRIGKALCQKLYGLGCKVFACSRSEKSRNVVEKYSYQTFPVDEIIPATENCDVIFNTVPAMILTDKVLQHIKKDALIIDLASSPGGIDMTYASDQKNRVIKAPGIPSKYAPESAGISTANVILKIIEERL